MSRIFHIMLLVSAAMPSCTKKSSGGGESDTALVSSKEVTDPSQVVTSTTPSTMSDTEATSTSSTSSTTTAPAAPTVTLLNVTPPRADYTFSGEIISLDFASSDSVGDAKLAIYTSDSELECNGNFENWTLVAGDIGLETTNYQLSHTESANYTYCLHIAGSAGESYHTNFGSVSVMATPSVWYKADEGVVAENGKISLWQDLSGNGNDLSQGTASAQPTLVGDSHNGLPTIDFDGSQSLSSSTAFTARTVFVSTRISSADQEAADLAQVWGHYNSSAHIGLDARDPGTFSFDGNGSTQAKYMLDFNTESASSFRNGADKQWAYDTFHIIGASFDADIAMQGQSIGVITDHSTHTFGGSLGEIMVFDRELTVTEKKIVQQYFLKRWGEDVSDAAPDEIPSLNAESNAAGLSISWPAAGGSTTSYKLAYQIGSTAPGNCRSGTVVSTANTSYTLTSLDKSTSYGIRVCSENVFASSTDSLSTGLTAIAITLSDEVSPPRTDLMSLWLNSTMGVTSDSGKLSSWADLSGQGHSAIQISASNQPAVIGGQLNGHSVIRFDGADDYLSSATAGTMKAAYVVFRTSSSLQQADHLASLYGEYTKGHIAPDPRAANAGGFSFDGNAGAAAEYSIDRQSLVGPFTNSNVQKWTYDSFHLATVVFQDDVELTEYKIGTLGTGFSIGQHQFGGDIAEIIIYKEALSSAEQTELYSYIQETWGI